MWWSRDTKTGFTGNRLFVKAGGEGSAYYRKSRESIAVMEKDEMNGPDPIVVAKAVARATGRKNPPAFITVGLGYKLLVFLKRFVPGHLNPLSWERCTSAEALTLKAGVKAPER